MEKWKPVKGFEEFYEISNKGRVRSKRLDREMKHYVNNSGYACIDFTVNKVRTKNTVHRLVALHFCDGYKEGLHVNHKDGNKLNNDASNLEWVTVKENIVDMINRGVLNVKKAQREAQVKNQKAVQQLDKYGNILNIYPSMKEAAKNTGTSPSKISLVCSGKRVTTGGYRWKLLNRDKDIV